MGFPPASHNLANVSTDNTIPPILNQGRTPAHANAALISTFSYYAASAPTLECAPSESTNCASTLRNPASYGACEQNAWRSNSGVCEYVGARSSGLLSVSNTAADRKNVDMERAKYDMEEHRAVRTSCAQQKLLG